MRILIAAWLSLLLVGMQQQVFVHEVDHLRAKVQRGDDVAVQDAGDATCLECALLAGGSNAAPVGAADSAPPVANATADVQPLDAAPTPRAPAFYRSRAPPPHA